MRRTKVEKIKRIKFIKNRPPETYIFVEPSDCKFFSKSSVFDCNYVLGKPKKLLFEKVQKRKFKFIGKLPDEIMLRILNGVMRSPVIEERYKKLF